MNNIAIIVGCQKYNNFDTLNGINKDIDLMHDTMIKHGSCKPENVYILKNNRGRDISKPTATQLLSTISSVAEEKQGEQFDNLFFYFSGHGVYVQKDPTLLFADTLPTPVLVGELSIRRLKEYLDAFKKNVQHIIMFLDICLNDMPAKGMDFQPDIPEGVIIFYSCSPSQESYMLPRGGGSLFTKCLVTALKGNQRLTVRNVSAQLKKDLKIMAAQYKIDQMPRTELPDESMTELLISDSNDASMFSNEDDETSLNQDHDEPNDSQKSIWLIDAEEAEGEQARFGTFTRTTMVNSFVNSSSGLWGIASVKGIGKTFLLQVKRAKTTNSVICFPEEEKPSRQNNWGTECVKFSNEEPFKKGTSYYDLVILWRYSLVCYIVCCWLKKNDLLGAHALQNKQSGTQNSQQKNKNIDRYSIIEWVMEHVKKDSLLFKIIGDISSTKLQLIIETIIQETNWQQIIRDNYLVLQKLVHVIDGSITYTQKKPLVLFLDKMDQTLREPNSEDALDCDLCSKKDSFAKCKNEKKGTEYCWDSGIDSCKQKSMCCYGCENFSDSSAGTELRIVADGQIRNKHCNYWQRLQLALVEAIDLIKQDYNSFIRVYYTVRLESFNYYENAWGSQRRKISQLLCVLDYSRSEQKKIYRECIHNQIQPLLFNPLLAKIKGKEDEAFVGVKKICHPYVTPQTESVFDIIYRHSFDRSRDIQYYGQALTNKIQEIKNTTSETERATHVKDIIEEAAAKLAYNTDVAERVNDRCYYLEKSNQMPSYWAERNNFEALLRLIDRNLLFFEDIVNICRKINNCRDCNGKQDCNKCEHHPFSMLYNLGMLGYIVLSANQNTYTPQIFIPSENVTYFHDIDTLQFFDKNTTVYLIHPALTKSIEKLHNNQKILHFRGFIIGKDLTVKQDTLKRIFQDRKNMPIDAFEEKYYSAVHP